MISPPESRLLQTVGRWMAALGFAWIVLGPLRWVVVDVGNVRVTCEAGELLRRLRTETSAGNWVHGETHEPVWRLEVQEPVKNCKVHIVEGAPVPGRPADPDDGPPAIPPPPHGGSQR